MSNQSSTELDCDEQLLEMFVSNAADLLDQIESDLLRLEDMGDDWDDELVNKVFRSAHTIKGESGFVGLDVIGKLSHSIENVLDMIRDRVFVADSETINLLLECFDELRHLTEEVETSNQADVSDYVNRLQELAARKTAGESVATPTAETAPATETTGPAEVAESVELSEATDSQADDAMSSDSEPGSETASPQSESAAPKESPDEMGNRSADVLIVDDDPMIHNLLDHHLDKIGISSQAADSCQQCLQMLRNNSYRVVVLDFELPDGQGVDIISEIRQIQPLTQVVMLTGEVNMQRVINCLEAGAVDFLPKTENYHLIVDPIQLALVRSYRWVSLINGKRQSAMA